MYHEKVPTHTKTFSWEKSKNLHINEQKYTSSMATCMRVSSKQGTKEVTLSSNNLKILMWSLLLNVWSSESTVSWAIVFLMPYMVPELSINITTSFEQVAAWMYQICLRQSNLSGLVFQWKAISNTEKRTLNLHLILTYIVA